MTTQNLITRAQQIIEMGNRVVQAADKSHVDLSLMAGFQSAGLSFLLSVFGNQHPHYKIFDENSSTVYVSGCKASISVMEVVKEELLGGWIFTMKQLVVAEIFKDFLEMSEHLLDQGYKDPAAVMTGSVLEEHLRQLCGKNSIEIFTEKEGKLKPKKAESLNAELYSMSVYNNLDNKQITAWLDLRNKAAHGHYNEYTKEQVALMIQGVSQFISRVPA